MTKRTLRALVLLPAAFSPAAPAIGQRSASQQSVTITVTNALPQPPQPVKAVRISIQYLDNGVAITESQQVTNSQGQALLLLSRDAAQRGDLRVEITGAGDLAIYQPAGGQLSALPSTIALNLLPKGSAALLGPAQIEAMLHRSLLQVNSLQHQVSALKQDVAAAPNPKPDLGAAIAEWAQANGFSADMANQQVQQWAEEIQKQSGTASAEQKALAELALNHYGAAAQLFNEAGNADKQQLTAEDSEDQALEAQEKALRAAQQAVQAARQALLDKERASLRQILDHSQQAASAFQLNLQFHEATQTLEASEATAHAELNKHHDDRVFQELWLSAADCAANARRKEGEIASADQSFPLLAQSASEFELVVSGYDTLGDLKEAAVAERGLAIVLTRQGERASADKAIDLFDQAIKAYERCLGAITKTDEPKDWALTENGLGSVLLDESWYGSEEKILPQLEEAVRAERNALQVLTQADYPHDWAALQENLGGALLIESSNVTGDKAGPLLEEAIQSFQNALRVFTKGAEPQNWAMTQMDLGSALTREGGIATPDKAEAVLNQAVEAYENALSVIARASQPQAWAKVQANLGDAFESEAGGAGREKSLALLDRAAQSFRNSLQVYTKTDLPQQWARAQLNLGRVLGREGELSPAGKRADLLDQAVQAFRGALEVATKAGMPRDWADAQNRLGYILADQAGSTSVTPEERLSLLDQAAQAYRNALEIFTKASLPQTWAGTERALGNALMSEAGRSGRDQAMTLYAQAVESYESALEVYTKADAPQLWAATQNHLGEVLSDEGMRAEKEDALALLAQAADAFKHALEVRTKATEPVDWATTQLNLGNALLTQGEIVGGDKSAPLLGQAAQAFQSALEIYTKADSPLQWAETQLDMAEAEFTDGQPGSCLLHAQATGDGELPKPLLLDKGAFILACAWSTGDRNAALGADQFLIENIGLATAGSWSFTGVNHYISNAPAFASARSSWIALFSAIQSGDSVGITAALHQLEPTLQ